MMSDKELQAISDFVYVLNGQEPLDGHEVLQIKNYLDYTNGNVEVE